MGQFLFVAREGGRELLLETIEPFGRAGAVANRIQRGGKLGQGLAQQQLFVGHRKPGAARGGDAPLQAAEQYAAPREPLGTLRGGADELPAERDVAVKLDAQLHGLRRRERRRRIVEIVIDGQIELIAGGVDGFDGRGVVALQVLGHGAVVVREFPHHRLGPARLGFVLDLHAVQRLHGAAGVFGRHALSDHDDGGNGRQRQDQARADTQAQPCRHAQRHGCGRHGRIVTCGRVWPHKT